MGSPRKYGLLQCYSINTTGCTQTQFVGLWAELGIGIIPNFTNGGHAGEYIMTLYSQQAVCLAGSGLNVVLRNAETKMRNRKCLMTLDWSRHQTT